MNRHYKIMFIGCLMLTAVFLLSMSKPPASSENQLSCELQVKPSPNNCKFILTVTNPTKKEIPLKSTTSQKYDFIVKSPAGKIIWQWSQGMMFTQVLAELHIGPKGDLAFTEKWNYMDQEGKMISAGDYLAQGVVTTTPQPLKTDWVKFKITADQVAAGPAPITGRVRKLSKNLYLLGDDGTAYLIPNPPPLLQALNGKTITVTSYRIKAIKGSVDKEIHIGAFVD